MLPTVYYTQHPPAPSAPFDHDGEVPSHHQLINISRATSTSVASSLLFVRLGQGGGGIVAMVGRGESHELDEP